MNYMSEQWYTPVQLNSLKNDGKFSEDQINLFQRLHLSYDSIKELQEILLFLTASQNVEQPSSREVLDYINQKIYDLIIEFQEIVNHYEQSRRREEPPPDVGGQIANYIDVIWEQIHENNRRIEGGKKKKTKTRRRKSWRKQSKRKQSKIKQSKRK